MSRAELCTLSIFDLAPRIHTRDISPVEVAEALLLIQPDVEPSVRPVMF